MWPLLLFFIFVPVQANNRYLQRGLEDIYAETPKCEPIRVKACQDLPYNITIFPNDMGQSTQKEAGQEIGHYEFLVRIQCSPSLKLFLCSLYFPVCTGMKKPLPPCRSLCEQNRRDCEPLLKGFDFEVPPSFEFGIRMGSGQVIQDCGIPCDDFLFSDSSSRRFSRLWIGLWSCLCAASTLFTVLTFLIDMPRFQYPERPIIYLSGCYLMIALTYVAGFILNGKVACSGPFPAPPALAGQPEQMPRLVTQGTKFEGCIVLFMLLYFFSMASSIWWVVLTITWYLAAKCHWAHEAISRNAQYLHFAAWAIPAAETIGVLAVGKVDGDPLSGVCFTGLTDPVILRIFLIAPLSLCLIIGTGFLFAGFVSLFKIRTIIKTGGSKTDDLEKLIMRIGVFSLLYIVPAVVVIACYFHESRMADKWMLSWYTNEVCRPADPYQLPSTDLNSACSNHLSQLMEAGGPAAAHWRAKSQQLSNSGGPVVHGNQALTKRTAPPPSLAGQVKPEFELFMIKYLMTLIVGITSGIWIWSGKTLVSWQRFFARLFRGRGCCGSNKHRNCEVLPDCDSRRRSGLRNPVTGLGPTVVGIPQNEPGTAVPLLPRQPGGPHEGQQQPTAPFVFNQDTTTTSGWASRGAPSGVTSPPPPYATTAVPSYATGWVPTNQPGQAQQQSQPNLTGAPNSRLGLV